VVDYNSYGFFKIQSVSYNFTEIRFMNALDFGKVFFKNGRYVVVRKEFEPKKVGGGGGPIYKNNLTYKDITY